MNAPLLAALNVQVRALRPMLHDAFCARLSRALSAIGWPAQIKAPLSDPSNESESVRELRVAVVEVLLLQYMCDDLQLPNPTSDGVAQGTRSGARSSETMTTPMARADASGGDASHGPSELWLVDVVLAPLLKRFRFHFEERRETNRRDKPEWMFSHVAGLIRLHAPFLSTVMQPMVLAPLSVLQEIALDSAAAEWETDAFMRMLGRSCAHGVSSAVVAGLCRAIRAKFLREQPSLLLEPQLFCHTLNETLAFERDLRVVQRLPMAVHGALRVFTQAPAFAAWLRVESEDTKAMIERIGADENWRTGGVRDHGVLFTAAEDEADSAVTPPACAVLVVKHAERLIQRLVLIEEKPVQASFTATVLVPFIQQFGGQMRSRLAAHAGVRRDAGSFQEVGAVMHMLRYVTPMLSEWQEAEPLASLTECMQPPHHGAQAREPQE